METRLVRGHRLVRVVGSDDLFGLVQGVQEAPQRNMGFDV